MQQPQVTVGHYDFRRYVGKGRWASFWHQLDEVLAWSPRLVLEIGPGPGVFRRELTQAGVMVRTLDIDRALRPDVLASVLAIPAAAAAYDVVCAFQMLEHLPYADAMSAVAELCRVARLAVIISLPDVTAGRRAIRVRGRLLFHLPWTPAPLPHRFDGEHHWVIGRQGWPLARVLADCAARGARLVRTYRVPEHDYHRFFVFTPAPAGG